MARRLPAGTNTESQPPDWIDGTPLARADRLIEATACPAIAKKAGAVDQQNRTPPMPA